MKKYIAQISFCTHQENKLIIDGDIIYGYSIPAQSGHNIFYKLYDPKTRNYLGYLMITPQQNINDILKETL